MNKLNAVVAIQFIKGKNEKDIPKIHLCRSSDGKKGHAEYEFKKPTTITIENYDSIQKMYLIDEEGELSTRKIDLSISGNKVVEVKSMYSWYSEIEFERFMRFAERYADCHIN